MVVRGYRLRWRIEDFHKAWKSGAGVERCRMQSADNILRLAVILAFVAVRILQLREAFETNPEGPCDEVLSQTEWQVLWTLVETKPLPKRTPTVGWAYRAVGRLAGWADTKRTGRVGWCTITEGWTRLRDHVAGYEVRLILDGKSARKRK